VHDFHCLCVCRYGCTDWLCCTSIFCLHEGRPYWTLHFLKAMTDSVCYTQPSMSTGSECMDSTNHRLKIFGGENCTYSEKCRHFYLVLSP
jgi:hypothetical protein